MANLVKLKKYNLGVHQFEPYHGQIFFETRGGKFSQNISNIQPFLTDNQQLLQYPLLYKY